MPDFLAAKDTQWLNEAACADKSWTDFFVEAGHTISAEIEKLCAGCPVRVECLRHAYEQEHHSGYFGGVSPGLRKQMDLDEAITYIKTGQKPKSKKVPTPVPTGEEIIDLEYVN